jgi:hypothetical protein
MAGVGYIVFIVGSASRDCTSTVPSKVRAEEHRQEAYFDKITIVTGHPTQATADGNTDCIDGGPNSVTTRGDIAVAGTYASIRQDIDDNLARAGYAQRGSIEAQDSHQMTDDGREEMSGLKVIYKNSNNDYIEVTYSFAANYPYICSNGAKICNYPDLQSVQTGPLSGISFDNLEPAYETLPADRQSADN